MSDVNAYHSVFSKIPIFNGASSEVLSKLESVCNVINYKKKDILALQGEEINKLLIVKKGMINLFFTNNDYNEIFYTTLSKYDPLGIFEIFFDQCYAYSAKALTDCEVYEIPRSSFLQIVEVNQNLQININFEIAELLKRSYEIIRQSNIKIEKKVLGILVFLAEEFGTVRNNTVEIKCVPMQRDIALMAGTTRETISRTFRALQRDEKIIVDRSTIFIPNYEDFKCFAEKFN